MTIKEMEAQANAAADEIVSGTWGPEELEYRKDAQFHKTMWLLNDAEAKRMRGDK